MVIVLASPLARPEAVLPGRRAAGIGVEIALAAAAAGARVELVGKVGDDPAGDDVAVELERSGVGHAALLRDPSTTTPVEGRDAALPLALPDVELALRYLADFRVVVAADPLPEPAGEAVAEAARYGGAHRVLLGPDEQGGTGAADDPDVTRLLAAGSDHRAFAAFVGRYAAFLDAGRDPGDAFSAAVADVGWEPAGHG